MNKKLFIAFSFMLGQMMAMEMTIEDENALAPIDTTEDMVVIPIQDQERELPARFIPLIGTLKPFYEEETVLQMSPITLVDLHTWQLIESQLERVYQLSKGNQQARQAISLAYRKLDDTSLINIIRVVDLLDIPLLKEITLEVAQNSLTFDEILELPEYVRNQTVIRKVLSKLGPLPGKSLVTKKNYVYAVYCAPDGRIISGSLDHIIRITDSNGKELALYRGPNAGHNDRRICAIGITPDDKIVYGSADNIVRIMDMEGKELAICRGHEKAVLLICVASDSKIISGSSDNTVRIWNMDGRQLAICVHDGIISSLCIAPDGRIVSGSWDMTLRVWDMNGRELVVYRGHDGRVLAVCITIDGKIISGSSDSTVHICDLNGQQLAVCEGHEGSVTSVCATPDGKKFASGSSDNTLRIWNIDGNQLAVCKGHSGAIRLVCITPDIKIVSGSLDGTVRVWDMNGQQLVLCRGHKDEIRALTITPDGKIVSGSKDGTMRIWDINSEIGLLHLLSDMNQKKAQAILQLYACASPKNKERYWEKMRNMLKKKQVSKHVKK